MKRAKLSPEEYLRLPYTRKIIPDEESGTYSAEIDEFPGCIAQGDTAKEAYEKLEEVAVSWIGAALDLGQEIPPPSTVQDYSGRFALRLPKSIHRQASLVADKEGTSLNQFIVSALSEKLGATNLYEKLTQRILEITQYQHYIKAFNMTIEEIKEYTVKDSADTSELDESYAILQSIQWGVINNART